MKTQGIIAIVIALSLAALAIYQIAYSVPDRSYMAEAEMHRIGVLILKK